MSRQANLLAPLPGRGRSIVFIGLLGYQLGRRIRAVFEVFNLFDDAVSDIDYYFASRLPGEPLGGVNDIHSHPAVPRTARLGLGCGF